MKVELGGGFINRVCLVDGIVRKEYAGDEKVGKTGWERRIREGLALRRFHSLGIAPQLFSQDDNCLLQEFVEGFNLENLLPNLRDKEKEELFRRLGMILHMIHIPLRRNPLYLKEDLEKKWAMALMEVNRNGHFDLSKVRLREIDWFEVFRVGTRRVHRDFWPGNVIITPEGEIKVIDWELAGFGSPYEDFAILELWTFPNQRKKVISAFWEGYGQRPNDKVTKAFLQRRLIQFLSTYKGEDPIGFYENKWKLLLELSQ
jgi:tRNA A-37 threonylcarbamoyl transferase component Bud32